MSRAPDYARPVTGWRVWRVVDARAGLRLWSVLRDEQWEPRRELRAACLSEGGHGAPDTACSCGIYAARAVSAAARYLVGRNDPRVVNRVLGLVALWGTVFEGADGWRGEFAYPVRIWVPDAPAIADALAGYGVPLEPATELAA